MNKVIVTGQNQDRTDKGESIIFSIINLYNFCRCEDENIPLPANMSLTVVYLAV